VDLRTFWKHGARHILAVRQNNWWSSDAPAAAQATVFLRGYKIGQYLSPYMSSLEVEERLSFHKRWGATLFTGAAQLYGEAPVPLERSTYPTFGAGLHFVIKPEQRILVSLEYAQGIEDNRGVYLKLGMHGDSLSPVRLRDVAQTVIVAVVILTAGCSNTYPNAEYVIEGERTTLADGTHYFGNELKTDLNDDGREDIVFLLTQQRGGSGTFFYAVAALNTKAGYVGSDGYLLGDRIAPEAVGVSRYPRHKNVIVVSYRDRKPDEPMTAQPSVDKTVHLKLDPETVRWGIVAPDSAGELR
jgi:hypothetical protein